MSARDWLWLAALTLAAVDAAWWWRRARRAEKRVGWCIRSHAPRGPSVLRPHTPCRGEYVDRSTLN